MDKPIPFLDLKSHHAALRTELDRAIKEVIDSGACGVGPGDEVITVANTFMATAEAITYCGARPVFVDVNETTYTMDPAGLEDGLGPRSKEIIPVHLFG